MASNLSREASKLPMLVGSSGPITERVVLLAELVMVPTNRGAIFNFMVPLSDFCLVLYIGLVVSLVVDIGRFYFNFC